jgi:DNA-directed RNA polymerase specialized sigma24 family protein
VCAIPYAHHRQAQFVDSDASVLHTAFLQILPHLELHARISFGRVRCPNTQDDRVQETIAVAWKWFVALAQRGKDASRFVATLATLAALAVRRGRRLCAQEKPKDVLSPLAQQRQGFTVCSLPADGALEDDFFAEALHDNTQTPPDEQAAFRLDFAAWRCRYSARDRRLIHTLMAGERTGVVARQYRLSPGRVSQLRRAFQEDWQAFTGELPTTASACGRCVRRAARSRRGQPVVRDDCAR